MLFTLGCEESLPPRDEIFIDVFETEFSTVDGRTSLDFTRDLTASIPENPPPLKLSLRFINTFDESLQGFADSINGYLDIWLKDDPSVGKRIPIDKNTEVPPTGTPSRIDGIFLTLDPGDTLYMEIHWAHESEEGVKMWDHFNLSNGQEVKVNVNAIAMLRLYPDMPLVTTPTLLLEITYFKVENDEPLS